MAMLITLVPTANVSAESIACLTEDPNADLYPFPLDMKVLSKYLYGSEENTKGKVYATYGRAIPKEWVPREMPQSLKNYGVKAHAVVHTQTAKVYFYPGGIDVGQGLTSTCGGLGTEQYGSWKPGVYFIPRKNVYITDARNQQSDENKPVMQYEAVVTAENPVNITSEANASSSVEGIVKKDAKLQVVKKNYGDGYSQVWFNSKECYKIDGFYYYYKLDDIAYLMSKTNKSFNVTYDKANDAIIIDSMTSYKGKAVTLKKGNGKNHKVTVPATSIAWDGKVVGIPCYKIDGAYYVSAAAIAELTDSRFEDTHYGWSIAPLLPNKIDAYG